jgi:hypothetical protein
VKRAGLPGALALASLITCSTLAGAADAPKGGIGSGRMALDFVNPAGNRMAFRGSMSVEQLDDRVRLDVTSLTMSAGGSPPIQLTPGGGISLVIDRTRQRFVVWSAQHHTFYWGDLPKPPSPLGPSATPEPAPSPAPDASPRPERGPFSGFKNLKAFSLAVDMSGRGVTNGHPSTGFTYRLHSESNDGKINDLNGRLQTADDFGGMPLLFDLNIAAASGFKGTFAAEVTSLERRDPPKLDFLVPAGYKAARSPLEVILPNGPATLPGAGAS